MSHTQKMHMHVFQVWGLHLIACYCHYPKIFVWLGNNQFIRWLDRIFVLQSVYFCQLSKCAILLKLFFPQGLVSLEGPLSKPSVITSDLNTELILRPEVGAKLDPLVRKTQKGTALFSSYTKRYEVSHALQYISRVPAQQ